MAYTDAPNAQEQMNEFLVRCREHDILCDSFHLSSGYTSIGGKRYVFNWDRSKFPNPAGFVRHFLEHGIRVCPNIKPCLLKDHPRYVEADAKGLFIREPNGKPAMVQFWDEVGAYLDFTNPETVNWWKTAVKESLLEYGIAATWNDNNEFEIWSPTPRIHGFGEPRAAVEAKTLPTLLMMRASRDAQREFAPTKRPFLVSRSGTVGMHRYVQTWSGDNYTSWESLQGHSSTWRLGVTAGSSRVTVRLERTGEPDPNIDQVSLLFRRQETRPIAVDGGAIISDKQTGSHRELVVSLR
jgi:alpha-glucosidase